MTAPVDRSKYGPWALVTGAAEGLGAEFARQIAASGVHVLLADVQADKARARARELEGAHGVEAVAVACDLAEPDFLAGLAAASAGREVGLLVCCAALGATGPFLETPLETMRRTLRVNALATLELVHHVAAPMAARGRGGIVIVASSSAYAGAPYVASYAASKAYGLSLGEALWYELGPHGVDVLAFSPQAVNTPGLRRAMPDLEEGASRPGILTPEQAVERALGALGRLPSLRTDAPESFSRRREAAIRAGGELLRGLARVRPSG